MLLVFPHLGRCYNATKKSVRFYGCDQTIEISFFIEQDALTKIDTDEHTSEAGYLRTFDANRERICDVAADVYSRQPKPSFNGPITLTEVDF
jgi:uncharacterized protein DUF1488